MSAENKQLPAFIDREALRGLVREVVREESAPRAGVAPPSSDLIDEETRAAVAEQVLISNKTYLTRREAAKYLNVSERSVAEWSARPANENPFPEENAGGAPRYKRASIDAWTVHETERQRLKLAG